MASSKFDLALPSPPPEGGLSAAALSLKMATRAKKFSTMLRDRTARSRMLQLVAARGAESKGDDYASQGDAEFYTDQAMRTRRALRRTPAVVDACSRLWSKIGTWKCAAPGDGLSRDHYRTYYWHLWLKMGGSKTDIADFEATFADDWEHDLAQQQQPPGKAGPPAMNSEGFVDSMFELADLWSDSLDANDYVDFLDGLDECAATEYPRPPPEKRAAAAAAKAKAKKAAEARCGRWRA